MLIQDALKETGKAKRKSWNDGAYVYVKDDLIYLKGVGNYDKPYCSSVVLDDSWQIYQDEKEIRPEKAGELWQYNGNELYAAEYHHTKLKDTELVIVGDNGICGQIEGMVHSKNGWTRLYPHVEKDVERIEIEGVKWYKGELIEDGRYGELVTYPETSLGYHEELKFIDKPPMKMILEIPKEATNDKA